MKDNFISLKSFLKTREQKDDVIFIGRTKKSILIGPYTGEFFKFDDFYKRITSNCLYNDKMYKNISKNKAMKIMKENDIKSEDLKNKMFEYYKDGNMIVHVFTNIP